MIRIGVIFGGASSEKEVSLAGGRNVYQNLDRSLYEPIAIFWDEEFRFWEIPETLIIRNTTKEIVERLPKSGKRIMYEDLRNRIDLAFLVTHGKYGDDGCLQGLLELQKMPYTGSGVLSSALGMDKAVQRILLLSAGVGVPQSRTITDTEWQGNTQTITDALEKQFKYPYVVKPSREGSSFGVSVVHGAGELAKAMADAFVFDRTILVEPYLHGREFSCIVVGNENPEALSLTETKHSAEIFTYDEKYLPGAAQKITPMEIDPEASKKIMAQAVATYTALDSKNYARIDGFYTDKNEIMITDPNSGASTGMGASAFTFHQAAAAGLTTTQFLTRIIDLALETHKNKKGPL